MYIPDHFRMPDEDVAAFLRQARTGTLVTVDASGNPAATFLPWTLAEPTRLTSHIGRVNPQSRHGGPALVILMGDDAYVSETWMAPGAAPSWNYETVHLYGELVLHTDPDWIIDSWDAMLRRFSCRTVADYDRAWLIAQARAATGVEVTISQIQAKSKLSQNHAEAEIRSIADHLEPACPHLADRMRTVSLPHVARRDERVRAAVPYRLD